jgi:glucokinase
LSFSKTNLAGIVSSDRKTVIAAGNLANWNNVSLADALIKEFGLPAVVENDANAAIWAEYKFGNAKDLNPVMFFIIGTGMGGGLIIDGKNFVDIDTEEDWSRAELIAKLI